MTFSVARDPVLVPDLATKVLTLHHCREKPQFLGLFRINKLENKSARNRCFYAFSHDLLRPSEKAKTKVRGCISLATEAVFQKTRKTLLKSLVWESIRHQVGPLIHRSSSPGSSCFTNFAISTWYHVIGGSKKSLSMELAMECINVDA